MQRDERHGRVIRLLSVVASSLAVVLFVSACSVGGTSTGKPESDKPIKIGFTADLSGVQRSIGRSIKNGFQIYLDRNGGKLGGRKVTLVVEDESDNPKDAAKAIKALMEEDDLLAIAGISDVRTAVAMYPELQKKKIPALVSLACTDQLPDVTYMWCIPHLTSYHAASLGGYVAGKVKGPVYVLGTDLGPGKAVTTQGFVDTFKAAGGRVSNQGGKAAYAPYSEKTSYKQYLDEAVASGAEAIYVWATGLQAVQFVKEYSKHEAASKLTVYAGGPLTCCDLLALEGKAALGIYSALDYTADLDNDANRKFVVAYQEKYDRVPNEPAAFGYSGAVVLDKAITAVIKSGEELNGVAVERALEHIGIIEDPRGRWAFDDKHVAVSRFYLRQVQMDGSVLTNVLITELSSPGLHVE
ncbi:MAG: ABC transporter substrate-binding protein [Micromonosporaceae bacterium]